ncbi:hypothetical protein ACFWBC_40160 [Streptomyces sp. NPDC059985]|uniref:hypothetical protein n=1 Tax=Streptomyces sp. NPDC059985 TaxID=3347025 RepID=UPI0036B1A998
MSLQRLLQHIALALGGQAGERLAERLATPVSGPTLLRLIRSMDLPKVPELPDRTAAAGRTDRQAPTAPEPHHHPRPTRIHQT